MAAGSGEDVKVNRRQLLIRGAGVGVLGAVGTGVLFGAGKRKGSSGPSVPRPKAVPKPRLGINVAGPADWNTELPFVDAFRFARAWISQREGAGFGQGPKLDIDPRGWVKSVAPGTWAETLLCTGVHMPPGEWTVLHEGMGTIELRGDHIETVSNQPGRIAFRVKDGAAVLYLRLQSTQPGNHVRNIRVLMPGFESRYVANPWNPTFLQRWAGIAALRFMDFMETNDSPVRGWGDRPRVDDATYTERGVPVEVLVDLANRLHAAPWFCMPHLADDGFVTSFAEYVKKHLDPKLSVYVEYSNEVWNGIFPQHAHAAKEGQRRSLASEAWTAAYRYYAERSTEIFKLWERALGGRKNLVRVLASQGGNTGAGREILSWGNAGEQADALAIAPYIYFAVSPTGDSPIASEVAAWTKQHLFDHLTTVALPEVERGIKQSKTLADEYGLKLVAYEGGQHLIGMQGGENNEALIKFFTEANSDPQMGALYRKQYALWTQLGGDLFCHLSSVTGSSKWGSWGLLQQHDDDPGRSPKFVETMRWARDQGQRMTVPSLPAEQSPPNRD